MAKYQEKLATSLQALKDYQEQHEMVVFNAMEAIGRTHTKRLLENGFLEQIIRGWYMPTFPGREGDSSVWYASFWHFVVAYCNARFGKDWCLTPEQSLAFHSGNYLVPKQLIVRSPKGRNNITPLKYETSLLDLSADLPKEPTEETTYGLRIYSLPEALCFASPSVFQTDKINVRTSLATVVSAQDILRFVSDDGNTQRAGRIAGAMQNIGRSDVADEIIKVMGRLGYEIRVVDPFDDKMIVPISTSPYATRIRLAWTEMRRQIQEANISLPQGKPLSSDELLKAMDAQYVHDAYHSLSIEGYRVTEGLIERVKSGNWSPDNDENDAERKNALAARGYYQAFQKVRESIQKILVGEKAGEVFAKDHDEWHFELFQPCVSAGIISASELLGYRNHQVYIRGSKHTPLPPASLRPAIDALCELMKEEDDTFIRAVLAHFFFVYIHPYMDGNGRTARFVLNVMLSAAGMPWTIVPQEQRDHYMSALETASVEGDIIPFARFIASLLPNV